MLGDDAALGSSPRTTNEAALGQSLLASLAKVQRAEAKVRSVRKRLKHGAARGYTIVELLMSLTVLALGTTGVIAMQKVTVVSNSHAKNLAVATGIAAAWADALTADGSIWNSSGDLAQTMK